MFLTITNNGILALPVASTDEGGWTEVAQPLEPLAISRPATDVIVVGHKPGFVEAVKYAGAVITATFKAIVDAITNGERDTPPTPTRLDVSIQNTGARPVRVILGDGKTDFNVASGQTYQAIAPGYLELRELGLAEMPDALQAP